MRTPIGVVVVAVLLVIGACSSHSTPRPHVVGIGDSLLRIAEPDIRLTLDSGYDDTITAIDHQRIDQMLPDLQTALRQHQPVAAVIENLGTNDVLQSARYRRALSDFDRLTSIVNAVSCVIFTTVSTDLDAHFRSTVATNIDATILRLHAQNPHKYQVVDWNAAIHARDGVKTLMANDTNHFSDGVHENSAGEQWFADQYAQALLRCGVHPAR